MNFDLTLLFQVISLILLITIFVVILRCFSRFYTLEKIREEKNQDLVDKLNQSIINSKN